MKIKQFLLSVLLLFSSLIIYAKPVPKIDLQFNNPAVLYYYNHVDEKDYFVRGIKSAALSEIECLTFVLYGEARGESDEGILAVAFVVHNRHTKWNKTYCQVVKSPGEFEFKVSRLRGDAEKDTWWHILNIAYFLLNEDGYAKLDSPIAGAIYFNSLDADGQQVMGKGRFIKKIGHHWFYK
jgi:hypothetical protein